MKNYKLSALLSLLFVMGWTLTAFGQYDDMYYDPDSDSGTYEYSSFDDGYDDEDTYAYNEEDYDFDDDEYEYYDDYDYHYSSRIRRFHRPYRGFNFYDPCYVDAFYYDPFFSSWCYDLCW